ncbi:MAG TPA: DUF2269 family protein [Actinopolymorphaceae bacterium]
MSTTHTVDGRAGPVRLASLPRMPIPLRWFVVVVHVISSVGWLGLTIGNLILAITGLTTDDPQLQHSVYRIATLVGGMILVPIGLITLVTGLLLSLLTRWGLVRHWWVLVKLVLTTIAVLLTPLSLVPGLQGLAELVYHTPADQLANVGRDGVNMLVAACVSLTMYTTSVVLSVYKPWGPTRRTQREHTTSTERPSRAAAYGRPS